MSDQYRPIDELRACHDEITHLLDQIPSISDDSKRRRYFETLPPLLGRKFGPTGLTVFHFAATRQSDDILKVFELEAKLYDGAGEEKNRSFIAIDDRGDHPFVYALIDYENGPNFELAQQLLKYSAKGNGGFRPQLFLKSSVEDVFREKSRVSSIDEGEENWPIWSDGLDLFRSAYELLLPQFTDYIPEAVSSEDDPSPKISWEELSTLHRLPIPFLSLILLGFKLKSSLRSQPVRRAFESQEVAVDQCLEFLETYLQLNSSRVSTTTMLNHDEESIFEFIFRMYFMQVGDPLQLMRLFRFFLSWANPPERSATRLLRSVSSNPLLNPIERLNYVFLMAASSDRHPLHAVDDDRYPNAFSIRDAIATIESSASRLTTAEVEEPAEEEVERNRDVADATEEDRRRVEEAPASVQPAIGRAVEVEQIAADIVNSSGDSEPLQTSQNPPKSSETKSEEEEEVRDEFSFLPALTLLAIGNCLCEGPPSLKHLTRRCLRSHLDIPRLMNSTSNENARVTIPKFILDYLRMQEYKNVKIRFEEQTVPNSGVPQVDDGPEILISFEKVLYLQIPVIHHC